MKKTLTLKIIGRISAYQWGIVTASQAKNLGVSRIDLNRLEKDQLLQRLAYGIYKDTGAPSDSFDFLRAAWLSTKPDKLSSERIKVPHKDVVVSGVSAASLYGIGDFWADTHDFVVPVRKQSQRPNIRYRVKKLKAEDITIFDGLPVMTVERTIADLVEENRDFSLIADALRDALAKQNLNLHRLMHLLQPLAKRNGYASNDGKSLLNFLLDEAKPELKQITHQMQKNSGPTKNKVTAIEVVEKIQKKGLYLE